MKTVALIETNRGGHHLAYIRLFSQTLLNLGYKVMAFYPEPSTLNEWIASNCPDQVERFHAFEMRKSEQPTLPLISRLPYEFPLLGPIPQIAGVITRWQHTATTLQQASLEVGHSPDLVFFNWLDNYFSHYLPHQVIDWVFPYDWSGIYFRPGHLRFGRRFLPMLRSPLTHYTIAQSSRCRAVAVLDENTAKELSSNIKASIVNFPDITDESPADLNFELAKQIREKAGSRKIIGLFGSLSKRKGLLTLLEAAQKSVDENWFFVFAGSLSETTFHQDYSQKLPEEYLRVQAIAQSEPSNCFFHFEHIPDEPQFNALINLCDVVFAAYENFPYSSNILTKAAVFERPVIVSDGFCMGERVKRFQIGLAIPEGDVLKCIEALHYLCDQSELSAQQLRLDFEGYRFLYSNERLSAAFKAILGDQETL